MTVKTIWPATCLLCVLGMLAGPSHVLYAGGAIVDPTNPSASLGTHSATKMLSFSGYEWQVRSGYGGPGPNTWSDANVWVDSQGYLHLAITYQNGVWSCAEVQLPSRLGFGTYTFELARQSDPLDPNIVLGLFNYPPADVGPDGTNEIDIEISQWDDAAHPNGNYTVWPAQAGLVHKSHTFSFPLGQTDTLHQFTWTSSQIAFESLAGPGTSANPIAYWIYAPQAYAQYISQQPMPVYMNLWLYTGGGPTSGKAVEVIIKRFTYVPLHRMYLPLVTRNTSTP